MSILQYFLVGVQNRCETLVAYVLDDPIKKKFNEAEKVSNYQDCQGFVKLFFCNDVMNFLLCKNSCIFQ